MEFTRLSALFSFTGSVMNLVHRFTTTRGMSLRLIPSELIMYPRVIRLFSDIRSSRFCFISIGLSTKMKLYKMDQGTS